MKKIIIDSPKYGQHEVLVDDEDFDDIQQYHWCIVKMPKTFYAVRYTCTKGKEKNVYIHRHILGLTDPRVVADHEDHNGLNNQKNNIRKCDHVQNKHNRRGFGKSKYLGVCFVDRVYTRKSGVRHYQCYQAAIAVDGRQIHLGSFASEEEAARARDKAARKYHGEFANLNFK